MTRNLLMAALLGVWAPALAGEGSAPASELAGRIEFGVDVSRATQRPNPIYDRASPTGLGAKIGLHLAERAALRVEGSFYPDFGRADWNCLCRNSEELSYLVPAISKTYYQLIGDFELAPLAGSFTRAHRTNGDVGFDLVFGFRTGIVHTLDNLEALHAAGDPVAEKTASQTHPTVGWRVGARLPLGRNFLARLDYVGMHWIETVNSTTLEVQSQPAISMSLGWLPGRKSNH